MGYHGLPDLWVEITKAQAQIIRHLLRAELQQVKYDTQFLKIAQERDLTPDERSGLCRNLRNLSQDDLAENYDHWIGALMNYEGILRDFQFQDEKKIISIGGDDAGTISHYLEDYMGVLGAEIKALRIARRRNPTASDRENLPPLLYDEPRNVLIEECDRWEKLHKEVKLLIKNLSCL